MMVSALHIFLLLMMTLNLSAQNKILISPPSNKTMINDSTLHLIAENKFVIITAEPTIYYINSDTFFYLKLNLHNTTQEVLGIELTDDTKIFINQWGIYNQAYRTVIDERKIGLKRIKKSQILNKFNKNALVFIQPNTTLSYFVKWTGTENIHESSLPPNQYLIISFDGQITLSNGLIVDTLYNEEYKELVLTYPIKIKKINSVNF